MDKYYIDEQNMFNMYKTPYIYIYKICIKLHTYNDQPMHINYAVNLYQNIYKIVLQKTWFDIHMYNTNNTY